MKNPNSNWPRLTITAALVLLVVWGLLLVTVHLSTGISKDANGNVVDSYQRSSDMLHTVLPLLTIALGYWFGAAGKEKAETRADAAQDQATTAKRQLGVVVGMAREPDLMQKAKKAYPDAFGSAQDGKDMPS